MEITCTSKISNYLYPHVVDDKLIFAKILNFKNY
jgi:hypothetical protein